LGDLKTADMSSLRKWLTASRALFSVTVVLPCLLGGVIAYHDGYVNIPIFVLALVGLFFSNIGANFTNDYYDYKSGVDALDKGGRQFKQGSEVLLKDGLTYDVARNSMAGSFLVAGGIGLYLIVFDDWRIVFFALVGFAIAYFYTAPPIKLGYRGLGEIASGLGSGPLPVVGTYFVLTHTVRADAVMASMCAGLLVASILYIGNVIDDDADRQVGKKTLTVRLGRKAVRIIGPAFYGAAYLTLVAGVLAGWLPPPSLLGLLTLPLTVKLLRLTSKNFQNIPAYAPSIMMTVQIFATTTLLVAAGFVVDALLG
jgi:1,4-dihydroxy-2-naphthoate octaprenyltransferase